MGADKRMTENSAEGETKNGAPENPFFMVMFGQALFLFASIGAWLFAKEGIIGQPVQLLQGLDISAMAIPLGLALSLCLIGLIWFSEQVIPETMERFSQDVVKLYRNIGLPLSWPVIVPLAVMAGIGEELFFRGVIQSWAAAYLPMPWAILGASVVFGLAHAVSRAYFVAATLAGLVLGTAYVVTGSLVAIMIAHAIYDIWAFRRLRGLVENAESGTSDCGLTKRHAWPSR